jgi:hypothetical protein
MGPTLMTKSPQRRVWYEVPGPAASTTRRDSATMPARSASWIRHRTPPLYEAAQQVALRLTRKPWRAARSRDARRSPPRYPAPAARERAARRRSTPKSSVMSMSTSLRDVSTRRGSSRTTSPAHSTSSLSQSASGPTYVMDVGSALEVLRNQHALAQLAHQAAVPSRSRVRKILHQGGRHVARAEHKPRSRTSRFPTAAFATRSGEISRSSGSDEDRHARSAKPRHAALIFAPRWSSPPRYQNSVRALRDGRRRSPSGATGPSSLRSLPGTASHP